MSEEIRIDNDPNRELDPLNKRARQAAKDAAEESAAAKKVVEDMGKIQ